MAWAYRLGLWRRLVNRIIRPIGPSPAVDQVTCKFINVRFIPPEERTDKTDIPLTVKEALKANPELAQEVDLTTPYSPSHPLSLHELLTEITKVLSEKATKYGTCCKDLDALVYVNLEGRHLGANSVLPDVSKLRGQG
jgi:hypothetical protein